MRCLLLVTCLITFTFLALSGCENRMAAMEEQHKATILRAHAELVKGNIDVMDEIFAPNYVRHCQAMPPELWEISDKEVFKAFIVDFRQSVSDYSDTITQMVAEGDMVAYVSTMSATQTGPMGDLPASGKSFVLTNIIIQRFENGKIAESWVSWDNVAMLSQLGFFPPPALDQP